jgi:hypothetical protein
MKLVLKKLKKNTAISVRITDLRASILTLDLLNTKHYRYVTFKILKEYTSEL